VPHEEPNKTHPVTQTSMDSDRGVSERRHVPRFSLLVYHREGAHIVPLRPHTPLVVGRTPPADVMINDVALSRQHARFTLVEDGQLLVEDLGSTNGTMVDGLSVERAELKPGEEVSFGGVTATFHAIAGGEPPASSTAFAGHERFRAALETEIVRARFFGRRVAVLLVKALEPRASHVRFWAPRAQALLRPVDRVGLYSDDSIHVLLPEVSAKQAKDMGASIVAALGPAGSKTSFVCGIAVFPDTATSVEELLGETSSTVKAATRDAPVQVAADHELRTFNRGDGPGADALVVAESPVMRQLLVTADRVSRGNLPILLRGETGSGKEVLSRYLHEHSPRRGKPLVCVNCAAIPQQLVESTLFGHERGAFTGANAQHKGVFEAGDGGTVFLDEIGELPPAAQAALLRVLETKRFTRVGSTKEIAVDVRVIAATHRDLETMVESQGFRQDLFFRLNAITLLIPPLRARGTDIAILAQRFLEQANEANGGSVRGIDPSALDLLRAYPWPGNVRELKNAIDRAAVIAQGDMVTVDDLPERVCAVSGASPARPEPREEGESSVPAPPSLESLSGDFRARMERLESEVLVQALREAGWNQTEAARQLSMPLRTLVYKIRMHGIRRPESAARKR
jgi:DNA-binding NtrC family response regulator